MNDMTAAIIAKSDQLNADDLIGRELTITITGVTVKTGEQPVSVHYEGDAGKPWKPCKSMCRVLVAAWGADSSQYKGKSVTLIRDDSVTWGGMAVGGIRISHMSHIDKPLSIALTAKKGSKKVAVIQPLVVHKDAATTILKRNGTEAAENGIEALEAWFKALPRDSQIKIKPEMEQLKGIANGRASSN
jgi:hypothetical protein